MKLINHTLLFLSGILFVTVGLWGVLFYYQLLNQVKTTLDEGLANHKIVLINKLKGDSLIAERYDFRESIYTVREIEEVHALRVRDTYKDTTVYSELKNKSFQTRLLTTAFLAENNGYYEIKVISQELDRGDLVSKIVTSLLWLFLFLFISTLIVNNFVLKKTWKPFYHLVDFLNKFHLDKGACYKPPVTRIKEFTILNDSVRNLIKTNVEIFNSQKQFIENASHELQTPLAIGINKLELLSGEKDLQPVHIGKIGNILEILQRLSTVNKSLLLLSKIENRQFIEKVLLNLNELIKKVVYDFSDYIEYRKIEVKFQENGECLIEMNPDLGHILVMNLIKNALIHNQHGGELLITMTSSGLIIENTSHEGAIPSEDLFKRFARKPKASLSTGLGLAIIKAIAVVSGVTVTYHYDGMHKFKIDTPQAGH